MTNRSAASPHLVDDDKGGITVTLDGRELRGWSYADDGERRRKMVQAHEYVEGWSDALRESRPPDGAAVREATMEACAKMREDRIDKSRLLAALSAAPSVALDAINDIRSAIVNAAETLRMISNNRKRYGAIATAAQSRGWQLSGALKTIDSLARPQPGGAAAGNEGGEAPQADVARLDWLQERVVDTVYLDDGKTIDVRGNDLREAIDAARTRWPGSLEDEAGDEAADGPRDGLTEVQKEAIQKMAVLERRYGKVFLQKSLHQARFDYAALDRVAKGLDAALPLAAEAEQLPEHPVGRTHTGALAASVDHRAPDGQVLSGCAVRAAIQMDEGKPKEGGT